MFLLIHFLSFSYFFFVPFIFIYNIKSSQSFVLFILLYLAISFSYPSSSYYIWNWIDLFAYWVFHHLPISFPYVSSSYYIWSWVNIFAYSFSMNNLIDFSTFYFILYIKSNILCVYVLVWYLLYNHFLCCHQINK